MSPTLVPTLLHRTALVLPTLAAFTALSDAHARQISFSGYTWDVKAGYAGPGPNYWSDANDAVWVDGNGHLHLTFEQRSGQWQASEIISTQSFGYGEYRWKLATNVEDFDHNVILGMFTYLDDNNEIDVEFGKFGDPQNKLGHFTTQPAIAGNTEPFDIDLGGDFSTHRFTWAPEEITWASHHGHYDANPPAANLIHDWSYSGASIPTPSTETVRMNLWGFQGNAPSDAQSVEVVFSEFTFTPLSELSAVPEPGALGVLVVGGLALLRGKRHG